MRAVIGGITGAASEARTEMQADGSRLRYYIAVTGPPLVLIHTVRTQLDYFQRVIPLLGGHYTVYALDARGDPSLGGTY